MPKGKYGAKHSWDRNPSKDTGSDVLNFSHHSASSELWLWVSSSVPPFIEGRKVNKTKLVRSLSGKLQRNFIQLVFPPNPHFRCSSFPPFLPGKALTLLLPTYPDLSLTKPGQLKNPGANNGTTEKIRAPTPPCRASVVQPHSLGRGPPWMWRKQKTPSHLCFLPVPQTRGHSTVFLFLSQEKVLALYDVPLTIISLGYNVLPFD